MFLQDKSNKNQRVYSWCAVLKRRLDYICFMIQRNGHYDFKQQILKEYQNCQQQRNYRNPVELRKISQKAGDKNVCIISRIAVSVTNQCSLRCRDCNNLMPYCKERYTIDVEDQIQDIKKILSYTDEIINVEIIGGEPFVYQQLPELLKYVCSETKIRFVEVTTNGTILPGKDLMELLSNSKVCVLISDYGRVNSEKAKRVYKYFRENKICVKNLRNTKWIASGGIENRKKSRWTMNYEYFHCFARKDCRTLYKGKLYVCGRAPILDELGLLKNESSFLNIRNMRAKKKDGKRQLNNFYMNKYAECCNYCDYSSDKVCYIESGIQVPINQ